jgi:subtilisin family serine protease
MKNAKSNKSAVINNTVRFIWFTVFIFILIGTLLTPGLIADNSIPGHEQVAQSNLKRSVNAEFVPDKLIVKFKPSVEQDMTVAIASNSITESSISYLNNKYKVNKATPLFKKRLGITSSRASKIFHDIVEQAKTRTPEKARQIPKKSGPDLSNIYLLEVEKGMDILEATEEYSHDPNVEYAEPDYIVYTSSTPNDPSFSLLWGLHNTSRDADIDAPEAWNIETGGSEVIIAVIDTGVAYTHEDLSANMWSNPNEIPGNGIDDDGNGYIDDSKGWDFSTCEQFNSNFDCINIKPEDNDTYDDNGHGTHCSGTIGAVGNNGIGVTGVNWNTKIMPLKFLNPDGYGSYSNAVSAILYGIEMGVAVMSNSWGGSEYSQALNDAVQAADNAGILFVAAAGNDARNNDFTPVYPASYDVPNIISVAATDSFDNLASFSNIGVNTVDLAAPGVNIFSTLPPYAYLSSSCNDNNGDGYGYCSGTSMATPHVTGVAGLILSHYPDLTVTELKRRILFTSDPVPSLSGKVLTGGRLNAYRAVIGYPTALFDADIKKGPFPLTVQFVNKSIYFGQPAWLWNFGDGQTSTEENPSHVYVNEGLYTVTLTVTTAGISDSETKLSYIKVTRNKYYLEYAADASFLGEGTTQYSSNNSGWSVASAGDVNGDGFDDMLIGAKGNFESGVDAGQSYLILGKASGWSADTPLSQADASFIGETQFDYSGYSVAAAGDVNGDGYDDILIGAYGNDAAGSSAGKTYLIFGKAAGWAMDTPLSQSDASFIGETQSSYSGYSVAPAGDVNGDGFDDILIGAYVNNEGGDSSGQTYLIFGKATGWANNMPLSMADASFIGENSNDFSGFSVAPAGDVNGDGLDDILIGAYGNAAAGISAGKTYLIFGRTTGWGMDTPLSLADASFIGEMQYDYSGYSVSTAGDVNGDGFDDVLIGAYGNDGNGYFSGQSYIIFGKETGWANNMPLSMADASFIGEQYYDYSGSSVSSAGDVNGDGFDDILIGAKYNSLSSVRAGQTYIIYGKSTGLAMDTPLSEADASFVGEASEDSSGWSVASAGDVNSDCFDDILIGAPYNGESIQYVNDAGQSYLILGGFAVTWSDVDGDCVNDEIDNCPLIPNPSQSDNDLDGVGDVCDPDDDNDGMTDDFEIQYGLNPVDPSDAGDDNDGDGLTNLQEYQRGTVPTDPDTDDDGILDANDNCPAELPLTIAGTSLYYSTMQSVYDDAVTGDIIQGQAESISGDIFINQNKSLIFRSGYDCGFMTNTGITVLKGNMIIDNGLLIIDSGVVNIGG